MIARLSSSRARILSIHRRNVVRSGGSRWLGSMRHSPPGQLITPGNEERTNILAITNQIVDDSELGSLTTHWKDGQRALDFWTVQGDQEQSRRLLERMLLERKHLMPRLGKIHGEMGAFAMIDRCYPLNSTKIVRGIVAQQYHQDEGNEGGKSSIESREEIASWVQHLEENYDVNPCDEVLSLLQIEAKQKLYLEDSPPTDMEHGTLSTLEVEPSARTQQNLEMFPPSQQLIPQISVLQTMTEEEDKQLAGSVLQAFMKACNASGIDFGETEKKVGLYIKILHNHESKSKQAFVFVLKSWEELAPYHAAIAAKHGDMVLYEMLTTYLEQNNLDVKPCKQCFSSVVAIHANRGDADGADRVLQDALQLHRSTGDDDFLPDQKSFIWVLMSIFIRKKDKSGTYAADKVWRQMLDLATEKEDASFLPPQSVFQHLLTLWSMSYSKDSGERAESILLRLQELKSKKSYDNDLPPLKFFELAMQSWANSQVDKKGAVRIEKILSVVRTHYGSNGEGVLPPSFGYLQLIRAWSRCTSNPQEAIEKVEKYFREYEPHFGSKDVPCLDVILSCKARIGVWLWCKDAAAGARQSQAAFDDLLQLRKQGVITLDPDATVYGVVANAWAKTGNVDEVRKILKQMIEGTGKTPDIVAYNYLLLALSRSKDPLAAEQAEELVFELEGMSKEGDINVKPNVRSYGIVMHGLSNSPNLQTASRAELYLQKLKEMYEASGDQDLKPNTKIYTVALQSLAKQRSREAVEKAQELLDEMHQLAREGDKTVRPDKMTYTTMLKLLRTANVPNRSQRARDIVALMKQNGIKPDSYVAAELSKIT